MSQQRGRAGYVCGDTNLRCVGYRAIYTYVEVTSVEYGVRFQYVCTSASTAGRAITRRDRTAPLNQIRTSEENGMKHHAVMLRKRNTP